MPEKVTLIPIEEHSLSWSMPFTGHIPTPSNLGRRQINWELVYQLIDSGQFKTIEVGLAEDWKYTHAIILRDGEKIISENMKHGFFGMSKWATPAVKLTKPTGEVGMFECWITGDKEDFPERILSEHTILPPIYNISEFLDDLFSDFAPK